MDKQRLQELAGNPEDIEGRAAAMVAELMMAHFQNPIDDPFEWFPDDKDVAQWMEENVRDSSSMISRGFRQKVLEALRNNLNV